MRAKGWIRTTTLLGAINPNLEGYILINLLHIDTVFYRMDRKVASLISDLLKLP